MADSKQTQATPQVSGGDSGAGFAHQRVLAALRERLRQAVPGQELCTVAALRLEFGVSQHPIDRALQELRQEGLIESRRGSGIYVTERLRQRHIGLLTGFDIFAFDKGQFPLQLLGALREEARRRHCHLRYYLPGSDDDPSTCPEPLRADIRARVIDGVVAQAVYWWPNLKDASVPVVGLGSLPGIADCVQLDHLAGLDVGVQALVACGCRRLAFLTCDRPGEAETVNTSLARHGAESRPEWRLATGWRNSHDAEEVGTRQFAALWDALPEKPDGLVAQDDYVAHGALHALRQRGLVAGRDLQIASHANKGVNLFGNAPVIRIEFDPAEIATALLDRLLARIAGEPPLPHRVVAPHLSGE